MKRNRNDEYEMDIQLEEPEVKKENKRNDDQEEWEKYREEDRKKREEKVNALSLQWLHSHESGNEAKKENFAMQIWEEMLYLHKHHYRYRSAARKYEDVFRDNGFRDALGATFKAMRTPEKDEQDKNFIHYFSKIYTGRIANAFYEEYPEKKKEKEERKKKEEEAKKKKEQQDANVDGEENAFENSGKEESMDETIDTTKFHHVSLDAALSEDGDGSLLNLIADKTTVSPESVVDKDLAAIALVKQTAQILNFTEKNYKEGKANPKILWYRMFYTEYITYIVGLIQKLGINPFRRINEREIFQALRTNIVQCGMENCKERFLDYYMSDTCKTLQDIGMTEMKLYEELDNFERDFKERFKADYRGKRIALAESEAKEGTLLQQVFIGYFKKYGKKADESNVSTNRKDYKEKIMVNRYKLENDIDEGRCK